MQYLKFKTCLTVLIVLSGFPFQSFSQTSTFPTYDKDLLDAEFYKARREMLRNKMPDSSVSILFSSPERNRSNDVDYTFHQDPSFFYLTGITEPNSVLVIFKQKQSFSGKVVDELLFIPKKNISREIWNGLQAGPADASALSGIQLVQTSDAFSSLVFPMSSLNWILRLSFPKGMVDVKRDETDLFSLVDQFKLSTNFPSSKDDDFRLSKMLTEMREIKQPAEIKLMRKAIDLSCEGHKEMMRGLEPGMSEYSIQAIGEYVFKRGGAETFGYPSICGGGENSCILHYESNRRPLYSGDLILLDMGGEYHGYSADITRTLPVNGKFTTEQKEIYELVYQAQTEAFDKCKPGNRFHDPHNAAMNIIANGLLRLGITKNLEDAKTYFMHNTSHYLGLDVHDPGTYEPLKEGNVITIEPGIYIPKGSDCDSKWWNIGIRIEDDVLITSDGYEILSGSLPSKWQDVEKLMEEKSFLNK